MKKIAVGIFVCLMLIPVASTQGQLNQPADVRFSVSQILPQDVIQMSAHKISDSVSVVDHQFHFNIETPYGAFPVTSIVLLEKRMSELRAIEEAVRISNQAIAVQGAWQVVKQTPSGAGHLLSDPLGTLRQAPRGFRKAAENFVDPVSRHAGSLARRKLAANLGVDSETRNPVLKQLLDKLVARKFVGETATKFALSAAVPGLGTLSSMESSRELIASKSPHELLVDMDAALTALGAWPTVKNAFLRNTNWTLLEKLTFVQSYQRLVGVQQADVMLYLANGDVTEADVLKRIREVQILAELHSQHPIESLTEAGFPIAWLKDSQIVGVFATDYLTNSNAVQQIASGVRAQNPGRSIKLISTGWISAEAQQTLDASGIEFTRAITDTRSSSLQPTPIRR